MTGTGLLCLALLITGCGQISGPSSTAHFNSFKSKAGGPAGDSGPPGTVKQALKDGEVVVVAFTDPAGSEDRALHRRLSRIEDSGVFVLFEDSKTISRYGRLFDGLSITRVPSIIVIAARSEPHLIEGFSDGHSIRQAVDDARREAR